MRLEVVVLIGSLLVVSAVWGQAPKPVGGQFQVNTHTPGWQGGAEVAIDPLGNFIVVWGGPQKQAQRFDANGTPRGSQFQVNSYTTLHLLGHSVAMDSQGNFVVVWATFGEPYFWPDWDDFSIQGRLYAAGGRPLGPQFQVNSWTGNYQYTPDVASSADGNFVVVWPSLGSSGTDSSFASIQGQLVAANGITHSGQFQVNSYTTNGQYLPAVAANPRGNFVVVWWSGGSYGTDSDDYSIQGQRFDADGTPLGSQFQVNSYTTGNHWSPDVASDADGNFIVVWTGPQIQGQRFDADGIPHSGQFQVNSYALDRQYYPFAAPAVTADPQGNFIVVWHNWASYGNADIQGQRFDADGTPLGSQFQVNSYTTSEQLGPDVATDADGNFVVLWSSDGSYGTDTDSGSIQGQRFEVLVFTDGFESGDASAWSSTVQ